MTEFFSDYGVIIAFFVGLTGLGTFIWNSIKGYKKQQDEKEEERMRKEAAKDAQIKRDIEERAIVIKADAEKAARDVKAEVERSATHIKDDVDNTAAILKQHNQLLIDNVLVKINDVDKKVMEMLQDLSKRADMSNGNVRDLRIDIDNVKKDIESVWDRLEDTDHVLGTDDKVQDGQARRRRAQDFERRRKRKEIDETSQEQHTRNMQRSEQYGNRR